MAFTETNRPAHDSGTMASTRIIEQAPLGILELDLRGRLIRANLEATELLALDGARLVAASTQDVLHLAPALDDLGAGRPPIGGTARSAVLWRTVTRPDERVLRLELSLTLHPATATSPPGAIAYLVDRTNEYLLGKAAKQSAQGLEAVVHSAPLALAVLDANDRIERWNAASETLFGTDAAQASGLTLAAALGIEPGDLAPLLSSAWAGGVVHGAPLVGHDPSGTQLDIDLSLSPLYDDRGHIAGLVAIAVDQSQQREREATLRSSQRRLTRILQSISETVTVIDVNGNTMNGTFTKSVLGHGSSFWQSSNLLDLLHPDDQDSARSLLAELAAQPRQRTTAVVRMRGAAGSYHHVEVSGLNLIDDDSVGGILLTTRDVTDRIREAAQREGQASIFKHVAAGTGLDFTLDEICRFLEGQSDKVRAAVLLLDEDGYYYPASAPAIDRGLLDWVGREPYLLDAAATHEFGGVHQFRVRNVRTDPVLANERAVLEGHGVRCLWTTPIESSVTGQRVGVVASLCEGERDPTDHEQAMGTLASDMASIAVERKRTEEQLSHQALHDELTGLANRQLLLDRLDKALARARRRTTRVGLMFLDLDRFKMINDSLGHEAGDAVIVEFASRLRQLVRPEDTVARFGGDEFVILIEEIINDDELNQIADRLEASLAAPILLGENELFITCSIGLAVSDGQRESAATLFQHADAAMYLAKERGRDRLEVFDEEMRSLVVERLSLENDLRRAVERAAIVVHYQPIVELASRRIVGIEALARWSHPERGLLPPDVFLPIAEDTGMIVEIGACVLDEALSAMRSLESLPDLEGLDLAVNLSGRQLSSPDLSVMLGEGLARHGWEPSRLRLEITEGALIHDADLMLEMLGPVRRLGVQLALDDFGTGYSSLAYLHRFAVDQVKIDRSLVGLLGDDDHGVAITRAAIQMAHALGVAVVAEGVESAHQHHLLRQLGCDLGQGWLFHRAMPIAQLRALLAG